MNSRQAVLPLDEEAPPGFELARDLVSAAEESALIGEIDRLELPQFVFQRWTSRRRTRSFGYAYDFRDASFTTAEPIPPFLLPLKARAAASAGVADDSLVQVSVICYETGAGIGWHRDRPELGTVIGVSLGAAATMRFRRKSAGATRRTAIVLPPRSVYHLAGEVRHEWEHSLPPGRHLRWSITFRGLTDAGRARIGGSKRPSSHAMFVLPASAR
ncbi:MAG: alpha-ketoglutarate-dependent dioxygenase AlkB [Acetobacteraceae bacterium]|nr:alpha-ketoglutarate-dependent dioxygenase AlkB [Acetobacteraceae bacterium]